MNMTIDLTERQHRVLDYIIEHQQAHGISPTVREICAHFGLRSPGGIHRILTVLKEKGWLVSAPGKNRSWRFAGQLPIKGIPILGDIAAGSPIEAISRHEETLAVSPTLFGCEDCFALQVCGNSMIDAHIMDGDFAIIRPQAQVENGEIAAVQVYDMLPEATLKIIRRYRHTLTLSPANRSHKDMIFKGNARKKVTVIGKYLGIIRRGGG